MEDRIRAKWWWNIPIILVIGILVSLGIRSVITDDNRFGWGTFSKQVVYKIDYSWVYKNGKSTRYEPGKELKGTARKNLSKQGNTRYSLGALKSWVNNYLKYLYENRPAANIKSVRAEILYTINTSRRFGPDSSSSMMILEYPPDGTEST